MHQHPDNQNHHQPVGSANAGCARLALIRPTRSRSFRGFTRVELPAFVGRISAAHPPFRTVADVRCAAQGAAYLTYGLRPARGFTLVELLVVLVILGLLAGLAGPRVFNQLGGAKTRTAAVQISDLEQAADLFRLDVGRYPSADEGLNALVGKPASAPGWNGPYLRGNSVPNDPWGNPYRYAIPGRHGEIDIYSYGADNAPGGDGENAEIGNWQQ